VEDLLPVHPGRERRKRKGSRFRDNGSYLLKESVGWNKGSASRPKRAIIKSAGKKTKPKELGGRTKIIFRRKMEQKKKLSGGIAQRRKEEKKKKKKR